MTYVLRVSLLITIGLVPLSLRAQQLDATDTVEIQQRALRYVRQFEGLLNIISQSDEYFRKYSFDDLIRNYYTEGSNAQIFRDSLVVIEDDLNPNSTTQGYGNLLTVKDYLQTFFSLYEKSPPPSVVFSNYQVSEVQQDEFTFVEVLYTSDFRNKHRAYPDLSYPLRRRRATVKAESQGQGWQVVITDISYAPLNEPSSVPEVDPTSTEDPVAARSSEMEADTLLAEPEPRPSVFEEAMKPPSKPKETTDTLRVVRNSFADTRNVYRKGKTYSLPVRVNPTAPSTSLILYQEAEPVRDLSGLLADSTSAWTVSRDIPKGNGYQLRLYDPVSEKMIESPSFAIKPKVRWPWLIGAVGAAAAVYVIVTGNDTGGENPERNDELPAPPSPE